MKFRTFFEKITWLFIAAVSAIGCMETDKDYYDPDLRFPNPLGEISAPTGFNWNTSAILKLNVHVNDTHNGQYYYVVEVFDQNPYIWNATVLQKGVAKKGQAFSTVLSVSNEIGMIFIRQTAPDGLSSVRSYSTTEGDINCDFTEAGTRTMARTTLPTTRGFSEMQAPDPNDTSLFPTSVPAGVDIYDPNKCESGKSYKVTASTNRINCWGTNVTLYITENVTLNDFYMAGNCRLFILPGVTVTLNQGNNFGQNDCIITVGENASLIVPAVLQIDSNYKLYNLGEVKANTFTCTNSSYFYNAGTAQIAGTLDGTNGNVNILNDGSISANSILLAGGSHMLNSGSGIINTQTTTLNTASGSWENFGSWTTDNMDISAWNNFFKNGCKLIVNKKMNLRETLFTIDSDSYVRCEELYMNNTRVDMGKGSLFEVTGTATYGYQTQDKGFKGTGTDKAVIKIKKAVATNPDATNIIHYAGALLVICDDHPQAERDAWNIRWTLTNGAEWASEASNPITIDKTECNEGLNTNPTEPEEPTFPILVNDPSVYTLVYEDMWPFYGDYDMNDIVLKFSGMNYLIDKNSQTNQINFNVTLQAIGATKAISVALMLDQINASAVSNVSYSGATGPMTFDVTASGVEAGQQKAVIPLMDNAHQFLGAPQGSFVNTHKESLYNVGEKTLHVTITFAGEVNPSDFNITSLNFFIIPDINLFTPRKEIHLLGYQPTKLANGKFWGNNDDNSQAGAYYSSKENLSWGVIVPGAFRWPQEYKNIMDVYPQFEGWVTSGGTTNTNWWTEYDSQYIY